MMSNPALKILPISDETNAPIKSDYGKSHHTGGVEYWKNLPHLHPDNVSYERLELLLGHIKAILEDIRKYPELTQEPLVKELAQALSAPFAKAAKPFAGKPKWSDEMEKAKAEGRRNPAQFIREEYAKELEAGALTRADLPSDLYQAYANWIRPTRHPEDCIWPDVDGKTNRSPLSGLPPEEQLSHKRALNAAHQANYREKRRSL